MKNWLDTTEYPFESKYFKLDGANLHYIDEGSGPTILFVHGTPSWSFDFRNVIKKLSNKYRCIAVDHVGFGLSDKPKNYNYSTAGHSQNLELFINELNLKDFTLVVHDFGGPIGLNMAVNRPELVDRIVILNSWLWSSIGEPEYKKLSKILKSPLLPFLYKRLNFSPKFILPKSFGDKKISKKLVKQYTKPFSNKDERLGALSFAHSLLNDQNWFQSIWDRKEVLQEKPVLIIWGMKDPVIPAKYSDKFKTGFPNSKLVKIESAGHFPLEENPERVTESIIEWFDKITLTKPKLH